MKLYICWTTMQSPRPPHGHPCHNAYDDEVINESQRIVEWAESHPA